MKDMNFFNEFLQAEAKKRMVLLRTVVATIIFFGLLGGIYMFFFIQNVLLQGDVERITAEINDPIYEEAQRKIDQLNRRIAALNDYLTALREVDASIRSLHSFTAEENYQIIAAFPEDVYISWMEFNGDALTIGGTTLYPSLVPAIVENLWNTGLFSVVYPSSTNWTKVNTDNENNPLGEFTSPDVQINEETGVYGYTINGVFKPKESE